VPALVGRPTPGVYSAELSLFVLAAGLCLLERDPPDLMYLSLSDYVQHKHAAGSDAAGAFLRSLDALIGAIADTGALVALTADHGMNFKPHIVFLQDLLDTEFRPGSARVICPITDPYVQHHGALGSFVRVYCRSSVASASAEFIASLPGVEAVFSRVAACRRFELPADREADLVVIGDRRTALGSAARDHDLSGLDVPLRSHGGLAERPVPFILSSPVTEEYIGRSHRLRNFDIFDYALNGTR
jgi:phosphonoacetate hydrolase